MRPRLGGAERTTPRRTTNQSSSLQCGRAWGARRGRYHDRRCMRRHCFNAAAPGGRGEGAVPRRRRKALGASMRPRLGGAERTRVVPGGSKDHLLQCGRAWGARRGWPRCWMESRWDALQCGRAWGARRGRVPGVPVPHRRDRFNAAAPGGRGEAGPEPARAAGSARFNAAAPGGRGEVRRRGRRPLIWWASMRPRLGGAERLGEGSERTGGERFNAAAPGGRGEGHGRALGGPCRGGFNAAAPGGRGEGA